MKHYNKKRMYIILSVLIIITIIISIGYSVLSSTLNITYNSVKQTNLTWDVGFEIPTGGTVAGEAISTNNNTTGISCGTATVTKTSITISDMKVSKPGDICVFAFNIVNAGDIKAKLMTFNFTAPKLNGTSTSVQCSLYGDTTNEDLTERICGVIRYRLCKDSSCATRFQANASSINAGATQPAYLRVYYQSDSLTGTTTYQKGTKLELIWGQS